MKRLSDLRVEFEDAAGEVRERIEEAARLEGIQPARVLEHYDRVFLPGQPHEPISPFDLLWNYIGSDPGMTSSPLIEERAGVVRVLSTHYQ
jgi:hypothetical protein